MLNISILAATVSLNLILIGFILYHRRQNIEAKHLVFITALFFVLVWSAANYLADTASDQEISRFWTRFTFPASLIIVWLIAWFSFLFPVKLREYKTYNTFLFLGVCIFSVFSMADGIIKQVELVPGLGVSDVVLGPAYPAIIIFYLLLISTIVYNLISKYRRLKGNNRMQVAYVIFGWALFIGAALVTNLILPYLTGNADWSKFGPFLSVIMAATTSYAIIRYRLFDIRLIFKLGFIYSSLIGILIASYLGIAYLVNLFWQDATGVHYLLSAAISTVTGVFGLPLLRRYFDRWTDRIFFRDRYDFGEAVFRMSEILNENINLDVLRRRIGSELKNLLKVSFADILTREEIDSKKSYRQFSLPLWPLAGKGRMVVEIDEIIPSVSPFCNDSQREKLSEMVSVARKEGVALFVMLRVGLRPIGLLRLGPKRSGEDFWTEDLELLKSLGYQIAVAIEKARLYRKIKNYSADLEKEVRNRTSRIEELQKEQRQMILDISHGLQTPLTIIKSELDKLHAKKRDDKNLMAFEKSIDRISKFIADLLNLSHLENKPEDVVLKELDLSSLLSDQIEYFQVVAENEAISVSSDIGKNISIIGNQTKIEELLNSIVSNSLKYIGQGKEIRISLKARKRKAYLEIADDGIGIDPQELPDLTKRFYRAKNNMEKGSGLGLAICQKIVELHGADMEIRSELGKGTTIKIIFPAIK